MHSKCSAKKFKKDLLNSKQGTLLATLELDEELEARVQRYASQILAYRGQPEPSRGEFVSVAVDALELVRPRRAGVEQLALQAFSQLKLTEKLKELGFNRHQLAAAMDNILLPFKNTRFRARIFSPIATLQNLAIVPLSLRFCALLLTKSTHSKHSKSGILGIFQESCRLKLNSCRLF